MFYYPGLINRYKEYLPVTENTPFISLGEGNTPLVRSTTIGPSIGCEKLFFKLEGCNPTGSFKDRGMVMAVARALEQKKTRIVCASTGNTSASASAYGARYGLKSLVLVPAGEIALGKLLQAMAYGARILAVDGSFDDAFETVRSLVEIMDMELVNSINPYRIEGQKTAAFEIVDTLGEAPDFICIPVGNAGNITSYWDGFKTYYERGKSVNLPKMMGFQAAGAAPIVNGEKVDDPETIASAIRIGNPASWGKALNARDESNGLIDVVTDDQIINAYLRLSREEGIFCEPASAAAVAGFLRLPDLDVDLSDKTVVCILTGNGLKDPDVSEKQATVEIEIVDHDVEAVLKLLQNH